LLRAERYVRATIPVVIFPEGGINRTEDPFALTRVFFGFKTIADNAGAAVYQITLSGCGTAQRELYRYRQCIGVHFHPEPVYYGLAAAKLFDETEEESFVREGRLSRGELAALLAARNREAAIDLAHRIGQIL
jgi:1-acyl-sn-glycerol-3-phosphate acyltransferase